MFKVQRFECNPLQENCYVVSDESRECVIIDCGAFYEDEKNAIRQYITNAQLKPVHLLATHGHLDHNFGNAYIFSHYGLKVEIHRDDQQLVENLPKQASDLFGIEIDEEQPLVGRLLTDGDTITFGSHVLQVLHTPGHSHGSCLYYCKAENIVFSGDTLFRMSIGRTDFAEGNWAKMVSSLHNVVATLPPETQVLSGHGPKTTIADELRYNPYLR
jgi:glyoxylase-like metal-dependent hydrolase (beta-lactamase superfamily II)